MRYGVLGSGTVGRTIASKLVGLGHEVRMGSRSADAPNGSDWSNDAGELASSADFRSAAEFGERVFNCTNGGGAVAAVSAAGDALSGKLLIEVSNPLDFSGSEPSLFVGIGDSLGERVQLAVPSARVVKSLNTVNAAVMVDPGSLPGEHVVFVCGDDSGAKSETIEVLGDFGWPAGRVIDIGGISGARASEAYLLAWLRLMRHFGDAAFNIAISRST